MFVTGKKTECTSVKALPAGLEKWIYSVLFNLELLHAEIDKLEPKEHSDRRETLVNEELGELKGHNIPWDILILSDFLNLEDACYN